MRILFILNSFGPVSGAEHVLIDFLKSAPEIEPVFLHIGPQKPDLVEFIEVASEKNCFYVPCTDKVMSPLSRQWFMGMIRNGICRKLLKTDIIGKLRDDETIKLYYFNNSFEAACFYPLFKDRKTIVHIHDMVDMFRTEQKKCVLQAGKSARGIITASKACKKMLVKNGINKKKIKVAYNSISIETLPYHETESDRVCIGFVGSVIKRKGFDTFVSIVNALEGKLKASGRRIEIIIITNTSRNDQYLLENIKTLQKNISKKIYSGIPREEVFKKYQEMSALIVPSRNDPLPTVVLEASLCGIPVFGSNVDGIPEMLCNDDFLFEVDDIQEAADKINTFFDKTFNSRSDMVSGIQKHIEEQFTAENKKKAVFGVIDAVLKQSSGV